MSAPPAAAATEDEDSALFARLAELECAEEAAEAAGEITAGVALGADPFMPSTPAQPPQGRAAAAASHPRLSQLTQLQPAGASVRGTPEIPSTSGIAASGFVAPPEGPRQVQEQRQQQQQAQQQAQWQQQQEEEQQQQQRPERLNAVAEHTAGMQTSRPAQRQRVQTTTTVACMRSATSYGAFRGRTRRAAGGAAGGRRIAH